MSDWPPKPTDQSHHQQENKSNEWDLLEKVVLSSVDEQKKTRKWGIFFKSLTFIYLFIVLFFLVKGCSISKDGESEKAVGDHLAVVDIQGTIGSSSKDVNSADTIKALKAAFKATTSKAVVLNINSPGGSPVESDNIWQEIRYLEKEHPDKKVYAVIGDMGASGAYYIASAANEIWVNPSSLVGSIGVIMPNYGVTGLAQKLGVEDRTLTAGTNKDILSMTKPVNPAQKAHVQGVLDDVHQHFIDAVKEGRGDRLKNADPSVFSGLFWSGSQAIKIGIADKSGNIETLKRTLKVSKTVNYTVEHNPLESLLGKMGAQVGQGFASSLTKELETKQEINLQ
ncbi:signal peptide peptidase SppA [Acinetobacter pollinis]|jgi:protease IV|uniref:signal peptide peptidase SppA n=1 Tax=Acinetobacter pollinis TaxID=2605270 RepID=UPI0018C2112E|nr:signal peptide peptidase SppA [Acinetobacter pollinis]MBF7693864.1 signal peptide peptidase SppA [Acinetobacter pollinis]MBF7701439.1 signal peptide peptidase SppA [Acinetobacter pollinis]